MQCKGNECVLYMVVVNSEFLFINPALGDAEQEECIFFFVLVIPLTRLQFDRVSNVSLICYYPFPHVNDKYGLPEMFGIIRNPMCMGPNLNSWQRVGKNAMLNPEGVKGVWY